MVTAALIPEVDTLLMPEEACIKLLELVQNQGWVLAIRHLAPVPEKNIPERQKWLLYGPSPAPDSLPKWGFEFSPNGHHLTKGPDSQDEQVTTIMTLAHQALCDTLDPKTLLISLVGRPEHGLNTIAMHGNERTNIMMLTCQGW